VYDTVGPDGPASKDERDAIADGIFEASGIDAINSHLVDTWSGSKSVASR
jgi:hypothetical protein